MDIGGWLRSLDLGEYEAIFRENKIDETVLPKLTAEEGSLLATEGGRAGVGLLELRYALEDKPGPFPTLVVWTTARPCNVHSDDRISTDNRPVAKSVT